MTLKDKVALEYMKIEVKKLGNEVLPPGETYIEDSTIRIAKESYRMANAMLLAKRGVL